VGADEIVGDRLGALEGAVESVGEEDGARDGLREILGLSVGAEGNVCLDRNMMLD
jgi:hypothetical protein